MPDADHSNDVSEKPEQSAATGDMSQGRDVDSGLPVAASNDSLRQSTSVVIGLVSAAVVIPIVVATLLPMLPALGTAPAPLDVGIRHSASMLTFDRHVVGNSAIGHPRICHVQVTRLEADGPTGVLICDAGKNTVSFCSQNDAGKWNETVLLSDVLAPAHATVVDIDNDDDLDILVAVLGNIEPDDGVIGRVVLLRREGDQYVAQNILDDVRRVADVQPADFDGDGDIDLAVAVFGYNRGQVLWLENRSNGRFQEHELLSAPGTIHVPVADYDGDGDPDIAAIVTQDEEELWAFENLGAGNFRKRRLWFTINFDLGSAGLLADDLDRDGDVDLILPAGDNLEDFDPFPQPYHGCLWFENVGDWQFETRRIADFGGTYAAATGDLDNDNDTDIVLVSMANVWDDPTRASIVWLENDGHQQFRTWQIDSSPTHLVTVAIGDLNADGHEDIVSGGLHIRGPYDRIGRVTSWINGGDPAP
ncbi:MAG: VCBS repeat-containing protein [Fuerstiella sp.]